MKTINLLIKEDKPICCIQNNKQTNYVVYKSILNEIYKLCLNYNDVSINEKKIFISNNETKLNIYDYKNNRNKELSSVIQKIRKEYRELKKKKLRKQKIKRIGALSCAILISSGSIANILSEDKNVYEDIKTNSNITILKEIESEIKDKFVVEDKTNKEDINLEETKIDNIKDFNEIEISFESRTDSTKFQTTKAYYYEIITKISNEYGIDPRIMLAIATQECGIHNPDLCGSAIGLMQIERAVWNGQSITSYNYVKGVNETLNITDEKLKDLEFNIRTSCMILRDCLKNSNYNLAVAIQMYNFGLGNMKTTFEYAYGNNINFKEFCTSYDNSWLEYREYINSGDENYLERILSYIEDLENIQIKKGNEIINYNIKNKAKIL